MEKNATKERFSSAQYICLLLRSQPRGLRMSMALRLRRKSICPEEQTNKPAALHSSKICSFTTVF